LAGAGVVLLLIAFLPVGGDWEFMRTEVGKLRAEAESRRFSRTVFSGKTTPGNAWDDYNVAMSDVLAIKEDSNGAILGQFSTGHATAAEAATARTIVAASGVTLDRFRSGVRREDGQYPYRWTRASSDYPSLLASRKLANLAGAQAKILSDAGHAQEATALALDMTVFARDLAANGNLLSDLIGAAVYSMAADSLQITMQSGKLTPEDLKDLAAKLESVERDVPDQGAVFANETLVSGTAMLAWSNQGLPYREWLYLMVSGGWRYGLSYQRVAADYLRTAARRVEREQKLGEMDFASAMKEATALEAEGTASSNPIVRESALSLARSMTVHREVIARLRLLRAAAIWGATGKAPTLADPLGTDLKMKEEGGKITIWSAGRDGKDGGGNGAWNPAPSKPGDDIVLEFSKPREGLKEQESSFHK
jgi:hypothetical protein